MRIKVFLAMAYESQVPLGGYSNFYFHKYQAEAEVKRYIDAGVISKGYVGTGYYEP